MVGRPVRFVGAETEEDETFALGRLRQAFTEAGFERIDFEMEPVAAAYAYESTLDHDELILIGDFGGGTSDFSLLHVGPGVRKRGRRPAGFARQQWRRSSGRCFRRQDRAQARLPRTRIGVLRSFAQQAAPCRARMDLCQPRALALPVLLTDGERHGNFEDCAPPRFGAAEDRSPDYADRRGPRLSPAPGRAASEIRAVSCRRRRNSISATAA